MVNEGKINIIIVDDDPQVIDWIDCILFEDPSIWVLDSCKNGLELLNNRNISFANLLLVDIEMPIMNGLETAIRVNYKYPDLPMVAMIMHKEEVYLEDVACSGFKALIYKQKLHKQLINTIKLVLRNEFLFSDKILRIS